MAVELLILSGARQRETLRFSKSWLIIGDDDGSDVCLSSTTHPQAKGQLARLEMDENGWWIHNLGSRPWYINRRILPVEGSAMLRSGDVLRLSDAGPDVRFSLLADARPTSSKTGGAVPVATPVAKTPDKPAPSEDDPVEFVEATPSRGVRWLVIFLVIAAASAIIGAVAATVIYQFVRRPSPAAAAAPFSHPACGELESAYGPRPARFGIHLHASSRISTGNEACPAIRRSSSLSRSSASTWGPPSRRSPIWIPPAGPRPFPTRRATA